MINVFFILNAQVLVVERDTAQSFLEQIQTTVQRNAAEVYGRANLWTGVCDLDQKGGHVI